MGTGMGTGIGMGMGSLMGAGGCGHHLHTSVTVHFVLWGDKTMKNPKP